MGSGRTGALNDVEMFESLCSSVCQRLTDVCPNERCFSRADRVSGADVSPEQIESQVLMFLQSRSSLRC